MGMTFTIGKWENMIYFIPTIIWLSKSPKVLALTWGKWYIGFDEKWGQKMGMTIDERIAQLVRVKHYASPRHYETLDVAIETMKKYQKIEEIVEHWACCGNPSDSMIAISEVLENGKDN